MTDDYITSAEEQLLPSKMPFLILHIGDCVAPDEFDGRHRFGLRDALDAHRMARVLREKILPELDALADE